MGILSSIFTWWNGSTIGTRLWTSRNGEKVGEDSFGNVYYRNGNDSRRWVIYDNDSEASRVPAEWHGWLHHTHKRPPTEVSLRRWSWQKDHVPNMTGTDLAYRPPGSLANLGEDAPKAPLPYQPWQPE